MAAVENPKSVLLILAGPAGVGKSTLSDRLVAEVPGFERVVTATTRPPRPKEVDGRDYHFLTPEQFRVYDMIYRRASQPMRQSSSRLLQKF